MRNGDTGAEVRALQQRLAAAGYDVETDGWYGDKTEAAVAAWQRSVDLVADGIAGPKTLAALQLGRRPDNLLRHSDIEAAAATLGVEVAAILAVNEVETKGTGFLPDGRPVILFERHQMYRLLGEAGQDADALAARYPAIINPKRGGYVGGATEHSRLGTAMGIDQDCALQSASWGQYQIMGFNYRACGFDTPSAFVAAMRESESRQLEAFTMLIAAEPAWHKALKAKKWADFAKLYNGPDYRDNAYDTKLARAYERHAGAPA